MVLKHSAWAALGALAALAGQAQASPGPDMINNQRVTSTMYGLALENKYLARFEADQPCQNAARAIKDFNKAQRAAAADAVDIAEDGEDELQIESFCVVPFEGGTEILEMVAALPGFVDVKPDLVVQSQGDPASWGLNRIDQASLPLSEGVPYNPPFSGKGVWVYVVDTGINAGHVEFGGNGRASIGGDFVNEAIKEDMNGHGSHCAGTVAGATYGVAREANVVGVKVLSGQGYGSTAGVIKGIKWAVDENRRQNRGAGVISMSLGGGASTQMDDAAKAAAAANMIVVVAAGNSNTDACGSSPARAGGNAANDLRSGVITVGSSDIDKNSRNNPNDDEDVRSSFSNYGDCVDIYAPGSSITSAWKGARDATNTISGTSMATPHVAGVAALMLEKHDKDREAAQAELFALAVPGIIRDTKNAASNLMLQVPTYTGPPTLPTPKPTMPPTLPPPAVCIGQTCTTTFETAHFGPQIDLTETISGDLIVASGNGELCKDSRQNMRGKVALIKRGGCLFFEKVKNAERQGARAAIIMLVNPRDVPFRMAYHDRGSTSIPSLMINHADGTVFAGMEGREISIGARDPSEKTPDPNQTPSPTALPTPTPPVDCTRQRRPRDCVKHEDHCTWFRPPGERRAGCHPNSATLAPTPSPSHFTPPGCPVGNYDFAVATCEGHNMRLCTLDELRGAPYNESDECEFDDQTVWASDTCNRGRAQFVLRRDGRRTRCRGRDLDVAVRCCL